MESLGRKTSLVDLFRQNKSESLVISGKKVNEDRSSFLYFPRKKVKLLKPHTKNPNVWFIQERLDDRTDDLVAPTSLTREGLPSGKRCAIIKTDDGRYLKLKGVAPNPKLNFFGDVWGSCSGIEAYSEMYNLGIIRKFISGFPIKPGFVECVPFANLEGKRKYFTGKVFDRSCKVSPTNLEMQVAIEMSKNPEPDRAHLTHVAAIEIKGDTRLDETVYHLTRKEYQGEKRLARDRLLSYLFFRAGYSKACMAFSGFSWGSDIKYNNANWGNFFVLKGENDHTTCCFTDLLGLKNALHFSNEGAFQDYLKKELKSFADDISETTTCSTPGSMKFRHFDGELRGDCYAAFETGYNYLFMLCQSEVPQDALWAPQEPERELCPDKELIADKEFRSELARLIS